MDPKTGAERPAQPGFVSGRGAILSWWRRCHVRLLRLRVSSPPNAPLAQLDRASGYEPGGRRFESCRARHLLLYLQQLTGIGVGGLRCWISCAVLVQKCSQLTRASRAGVPDIISCIFTPTPPSHSSSPISIYVHPLRDAYFPRISSRRRSLSAGRTESSKTQ